MISWPERCADKDPNTYSTAWASLKEANRHDT